VQPKETVAVVSDDPDDDKFLACAVVAEATTIISGDPHLLALGSYLPPPGLPPLGGGAFMFPPQAGES
jgi:hypothetical protein